MGVTDVSALTAALFGPRFGEVHEPWRRLFASEPFRDNADLSPDDRMRRSYERLRYVDKSVRSVEDLVSDVESLTALHEWACPVDCGTTMLAGIHYNLFLGSLHDHTPHELRSLRDYAPLQRTGTFLCTELAHGNSAADLETTAVYDPLTACFDLHTPHPGARKFMPNTSAIGGPKTAVVAARLIVDGEDEGVFLFLTPLSDESGPLPGVEIRWLPERMGSPIDHCLTGFDHVRLPRHALLESERGRILPDGSFAGGVERRRRFLYSIGRVTEGKLCMSATSLGGTRAALAIAIRYAHTRRTSGLTQVAGGSVPLFAYRSHHARLLDALATVYAATLLHRTTVRQWAAHTAHDRGQAENLVAIAKGWITWQCRDVLIECRERCGAQGLFLVNGLADFLTGSELPITAEGDNLPIWLKAAGKMLLRDPLPPPPPAPAPALTSPRFLHHLMVCLEHIWDRRARAAFERCADPHPLNRWNAATNPALELVAAHAQRLAGDALLNAAADVPDATGQDLPQPGVPDATGQDLLHLLHRIFALRRISPHSGSLMAAGHLSAEHVEQFPIVLDEAIARLAPYALLLVDAFAIPEEILRRYPIARLPEKSDQSDPGALLIELSGHG
ncbi:acyl-CoA dehydrogenase [Nonomuraea sp. CA-143628]|uniref:acyl-CoA dehydrogenase family protein n=1 Tax=Nonomuraea sp. CA-143628 TaxID=3239997 RepID=UPI003D8A6BB5